MKKILEGLAYDDVLIVPQFAEIMPAQVRLQTRFSRNITLNIPIVSAPMDKVTRHKLAIAMALHGGIGVLDRNMSIVNQAEEIYSVKRHMSTVIANPYTLSPRHTVGDAYNLMREKSISGIPITNSDGRLVGIITKRDLHWQPKSYVPIEDLMTKAKDNLITAPAGTTPEQAERIFRQFHVEKLPLVDENLILKGLITLKDIEKKNIFPIATLDPRGQLRVAAAIGATGDYLERATALVEAGVDALVIDSSHAHSRNVFNALVTLKKAHEDTDIVVGNVATAQGARDLCDYGADAIKIGIGPGSICTTRVVTGAGVPQISAIMWVYERIQDEVPLIADGGIRYSGDITKAIAAGASCVMIGSLFAGTDESPGETILSEGRVYKAYRGMGSVAVLQSGGDRYGSKAVPEGIEAKVPHKGCLSMVLDQLVGGLRQGMGYAGCETIDGLKTKTIFVRISHAGLLESHPHGVLITNEAPNYQTM